MIGDKIIEHGRINCETKKNLMNLRWVHRLIWAIAGRSCSTVFSCDLTNDKVKNGIDVKWRYTFKSLLSNWQLDKFVIYERIIQIPGPSCSKLTTSLVNDLLKFTSSDMQICWTTVGQAKEYAELFCWKSYSHFFSKKISEYCVLNPLKQLTKWPLTSSLS